MSDMTRQTWAVRTFDRERLAPLIDGLAVALAVSLPWSTSATGILVVLWLIVAVPTMDIPSLRRVLSTAAGGLPVLLWVVAVIGTLWAFDVSLAERWAGLKAFHKLLVIPLLIVHFQSSERAGWVINGFVISCCILLVLSWILFFAPDLFGTAAFHTNNQGVPVKDYIAQSEEFTFCAFLLASLALRCGPERRLYAIFLVLLIAVLLINVLYVAHSRTALVIIPALLLVFAWKHLKWKGMTFLLLTGVLATVLTWILVPPARDNVTNLWNEMQHYEPTGDRTRAGERLEFWRKSIGFIAHAPVIGHGTGSVRDQFRRAASHETGVAAVATENPHNQTFGIAIQLGLLGGVVLFAMWISHFLLFRGDGIVAWIGLVIVTENIVGSLFNSHLFDFTQGWSYVVGVGVTAGAVFKDRGLGAFKSAAPAARAG